MSVNARGVNVHLFVGEDESEDELLRRYRKAVWEAGLLQECRRRRYFESPQDVKKRKNQTLRKKKKRFAQEKSQKN